MTRPQIFRLSGSDALERGLIESLDAERGLLSVRSFPDGESYLRFESPLAGRPAVLLCGLESPNEKFLPLAFAAATARDLGASGVGLVAPYLAYMRQDRRFRPGEAVTSRSFAGLLSGCVDWLATVDPHLHRYKALSEIYACPALAVPSAPLLSGWIGREVERPILIGPDEESAQWVEAVAKGADAPFLVLEKQRKGDREVEISLPDLSRWRDRTPVLVDDIVSTGQTMAETLRHLRRAGLAPAVCLGVHGIFSGDAYEELRRAGAARIVTTNSIAHPSNAIDLSGALARAIRGAGWL